MPDSNDIIYNQYGANFFGLLEALFRTLFGGGGAHTTTGTPPPSIFDALTAWGATVWGIVTVVGFLLSALFVWGIVYAYIRDGQLAEVETEGVRNNEQLYAQLHGTDSTNRRFDDIERHISTDNPNDWKLAIIEADIMLGEMLDAAGYAGVTIGDKLKSANPEAFRTLNEAWKAHRVRNDIAHAGPDFVLTKKLASDTITQYRMVFTEFGVV